MHKDSKLEFERLKKLLLERYYERSIIEEAVKTRDYSAGMDSTKEFRKIGTSMGFEEDVFADSTHYLDLLFDQVADSIVLGEKEYLVDKMLKQESKPELMDRFTYDNLWEMIVAKFRTTEPSIIFMPLTLFSRIRLEWTVKNRMTLEVKDGHYRIVLDGYSNRPQLVWSNKYMPFDSILVASKEFGEWVAKPKVKDRVRVTRDGLTLHAYSVFSFQILDPKQVLRIDVNPQELDKRRLDELTRAPVE